MVPSRLNAFRGSGGVRHEDDILVTEDGFENLSLCPRTASEVESVIRGGAWPPARDEAPELKRAWSRPRAQGKGMERYTLATNLEVSE